MGKLHDISDNLSTDAVCAAHIAPPCLLALLSRSRPPLMFIVMPAHPLASLLPVQVDEECSDAFMRIFNAKIARPPAPPPPGPARVGL